MADSSCFGLSGNLEFPDFLQKSFIISTTGWPFYKNRLTQYEDVRHTAATFAPLSLYFYYFPTSYSHYLGSQITTIDFVNSFREKVEGDRGF